MAGTDQNVGEMILFEACERIAYHGPLAVAEAQSVTLPARIPATPDRRLGNVKRTQLAHDAQGNETPFWPPDVDRGTPEPTVGEYFATVLAGRGMGQTAPRPALAAAKPTSWTVPGVCPLSPAGPDPHSHCLLAQPYRGQSHGQRHDRHPALDLLHRERDQ